MARETHDKEDWIAEATGIPFRAQFSIEGLEHPVVWGYRMPGDGSLSGIGAASFLIGDEPVFHWNSQLELRRAYFDGRLIKAEDGRLVAWKKERRDGQVQMLRQEFDDAQHETFIATLQESLSAFESGLTSKNCQQLRAAVPDGIAVDMATQAKLWLAALPNPLTVAAIPNVS